MGHIHKKSLRAGLLVLAFCLAVGILISPGKVLAYGKISTNPASVNVAEGGSQAIQFQLNAPIICPNGSNPCNVVLNFTNPDPTHLSFDTTTITWNYDEWSQLRTINVTALNDGVFTPNLNFTLSATAVSNSVYYSGFQESVPLTFTNTYPVPAPTLVDQNVPLVNNGTATTVDTLSGAGDYPDSSTLVITTPPSHGIAVDPPGTITYTPTAGYAGNDTLSFTICSLYDNTVCSIGHLNFTVTLPTLAAAATITPALTDTGINLDATSYIATMILATAVVVYRFPMTRIRGLGVHDSDSEQQSD
jgi:hypothetical protein